MKFSVIVPIYNVEKYIEKCLESIKKQTFKDYEVILVNDGTTDDSLSIVKKYLNDSRFKLFHKENGGLSSARNYGVDKANGEYIIFVDSDDYIEYNLLQQLYDTINKNDIDLIRYGIYLDEKNIIKTKHKTFPRLHIKECIFDILESTLVEPAWAYCYKTDFYKKNNFRFEEGRYHEDFGLIPYIFLKANYISSIPFYGYHYVIHDDSIMTTTDKIKSDKKMRDTLYLFDELVQKINKDITIDPYLKEVMLGFLANILITRSKVIDNLDEYIKDLNKRNISKYLISNNLSRKIKKMLVKLNLKLYIKLFVK